MKFFEPGALIPGNEGFDATSKGSVEAAWTTAGYDVGKHPALAFFTAFSRYYVQKHDLPAIAGGILVGFSSSFLFTSPFEEERDFHGSLFFEEGKLGINLIAKL